MIKIFKHIFAKSPKTFCVAMFATFAFNLRLCPRLVINKTAMALCIDPRPFIGNSCKFLSSVLERGNPGQYN